VQEGECPKLDHVAEQRHSQKENLCENKGKRKMDTTDILILVFGIIFVVLVFILIWLAYRNLQRNKAKAELRMDPVPVFPEESARGSESRVFDVSTRATIGEEQPDKVVTFVDDWEDMDRSSISDFTLP
jgi:flagellar biosynthesis/type III secretory pathway M-ring protein FliF/YscJ